MQGGFAVPDRRRWESKLPGLSFRLRLTLFFFLIVFVPMVVLAVLVSEIAADSAAGKADARLDAGLRTATNLYEQEERRSRADARRIASTIDGDDAAVATLEDGTEEELAELAERLADSAGVAALELESAAGERAAAGSRSAVATASVELVGPTGEPLGTVRVASTSSARFLDSVEVATGESGALVGPRGPITGTVEIETGALPESGEAGELEREGEDLRIAATEPLGSDQVRVALVASGASEGFFASRPKVALALVAFFTVALLAVLLVFRSLQSYIREMLAAAQRIGEGNFDAAVPITGEDEMAGLASEFNRMSDRLSDQMDQLRRQRVEIESSVRRIGEAFASGLDRQGLLAILVETAVGSCDADYGLVALSGQVGAEAEAGKADEAIHEAALAAEQRALREVGPVETERNGAYALASSMGRIGPAEKPVGAMTVARAGRPFTRTEREVFLYLLTQASTSVENVALHEMVSEQAVTDDLTGLANKRAFREAIETEAARAARFGHDLSLLICDLDDFKQVNDTHGHLQGDEVLRTVGRILDDASRGIDVPARYGGEEFAVALPETDPDGALEFAERVRAAIEGAPVPMLDGGGELAVTASVGVATMPGAGANGRSLIAAADAALYEAKRGGKNRVRVAPADGAPLPSDRRAQRPRSAQGPASERRT